MLVSIKDDNVFVMSKMLVWNKWWNREVLRPYAYIIWAYDIH